MEKNKFSNSLPSSLGLPVSAWNVFRIRVCSLGYFPTIGYKRVVLDCGVAPTVPKQRGLPSCIFLFAGCRLVCVREELAFQVLPFILRGVLWDAVIRGVGYDQAELKALNVSLRVGDKVAPTPSGLLS